MTAKLWRRILNVFAPGTITAVDDTGPVLRAQVTIGYLETVDDVPVLQQFGFASVPPLGSDVALVFIGGDRSNGAGVATNNQASRVRNKAPGESVIFNAFGMSIYLSAEGVIINGGGLPVQIINGDLHTGNITMTGTLAVTGGPIKVNGTNVTVP